ncbi:MAG: HAD family hydrolase [Edaphocola sp.]
MATALFLDRDGVINVEKDGSYIFSIDEFEFYPGALQTLSHLTQKFDYVFVVTNQRGIGRGLMTEKQLTDIHDHMVAQIEHAGGKITAIYFAPSPDRNHPDRKPNTGMAQAALRQYPDIEFDKSIMIGNNLSDMQFGKSMGMRTIFLTTTAPGTPLPHPLIDRHFDSIASVTL